jgi:hypothetical protein
MLRERRLFTAAHGRIGHVVDEILALDRDDEVVLIFNDVIVPIDKHDSRCDVLVKWENARELLVSRS